MEIEGRAAGIPCIFKITHQDQQERWKGSAHTCPSDLDWYGYWDIEYEVLDRRGRPALWLAKKITEKENDEIIDYLKGKLK